MIIHPNFDPVAVVLGPLQIHWYGLMYLFGFVAGVLLGRARAARPGSGWQPAEISDLLFFITIGVIVGGRLGYVVFYGLDFYLQQPLQVFAIWDGGMSFHGGLIGVAVAIWRYAGKTGRRLLPTADFLAPLVPPGLFFGRIGNFINQELVGRPTDVPWGVLFHSVPDHARHPSQLYQMALEGGLLFALVWLYSSRPRPAGRVTGLFLIGYGGFRFLVEFFRQPDVHLGAVVFDWMSMGQVLCIPMIVAGLLLLLRPGGPLSPRRAQLS